MPSPSELGHCDGRRGKTPAWKQEQQAEDCARDRMRALGIPVPRKETRRAKEYVAYRKAMAQRRRRG